MPAQKTFGVFRALHRKWQVPETIERETENYRQGLHELYKVELVHEQLHTTVRGGRLITDRTRKRGWVSPKCYERPKIAIRPWSGTGRKGKPNRRDWWGKILSLCRELFLPSDAQFLTRYTGVQIMRLYLK